MEYWITDKTTQEMKNMRFSLIGQAFKQLKLIKGDKVISDKTTNKTFDRLNDMSINELEATLIRLDALLKKVMEERLHPEIKWKREKIQQLAEEINEAHARLKEFKKHNEDQALIVPLQKHEEEILREWCKLAGKTYFPYKP